jgi:hypothetical protein
MNLHRLAQLTIVSVVSMLLATDGGWTGPRGGSIGEGMGGDRLVPDRSYELGPLGDDPGSSTPDLSPIESQRPLNELPTAVPDKSVPSGGAQSGTRGTGAAGAGGGGGYPPSFRIPASIAYCLFRLVEGNSDCSEGTSEDVSKYLGYVLEKKLINKLIKVQSEVARLSPYEWRV